MNQDPNQYGGQSPLKALDTFRSKISYQRSLPNEPYKKYKAPHWNYKSVKQPYKPSQPKFSELLKSQQPTYNDPSHFQHNFDNPYSGRGSLSDYPSRHSSYFPTPSSPTEPSGSFYEENYGQGHISEEAEAHRKDFTHKSEASSQNNKRPPPIEIDPNLPPSIAVLFKTNSCDLCDVKLNSRIQSKTHYDGKPHAKKVKSAWDKYRAENAETPSQGGANESSSTMSPPAKKKSISIDGSELYCKTCDLSFTSLEHATQHYLGRNHQRVLHGLKPLKTGYFNKDSGKWQRMPADPITPTEQIISCSESPSSQPLVKEKGKFYCELCGVSTTSQDQLDGHKRGQKHKKIQQMAEAKKTAGSSDSLLASVSKGEETKKVKRKDFSIYRTPSGKFYCSFCDSTLNSETQFAQHVESKKHKLKKK